MEGCPVHNGACRPVPWKKGEKAPREGGLFILAEGPGDEEVAKGEPLVGPTGRFVERMLQRIKDPTTSRGIVLADFDKGNVVNCFPGDCRVSLEGAQRIYRRWYDGPLVVVKTERGSFSGTPNHPVLTNHGWVALEKLQVGDHLVHRVGIEGVGSSDPNEEDTPPKFVEVFSSAASLRTNRGIVGADADFHGDGSEGQVDVVPVDGLLWDRVEAAFVEHSVEKALESANVPLAALGSGGPGECGFSEKIKSLFPAADGLVGLSHSGQPGFGSGVVLPPLHGGLASSNGESCGNEPDLESLRVDVDAVSQVLHGRPGQVSLAEVLDVGVTEFNGHVFNLETSYGDYTANGFVVHNCKSEGLFLGDDPRAPELAEYWRPIVKERLAELKPSVVFAMGAWASEFFLGDIFDEVKEWRGYVEEFDWGWGPFHVVFSYHPSFLMRGNFSLCEVWQYDFKRALSVWRHGWHPEPVHYVLTPTPQDAREFFDEWRRLGRPTLAFDIETPYSNNEEELSEDDLLEDVPDASWEVMRISFAFEEKRAITFPWQPPFIDMALDALEEAPFTTVWNAPFDVPRLERQALQRGRTIFKGYVCDAMDAHKFLKPHLPRRLKFVATLWTDLSQWAAHRGKGEEVYSCTDSDALIRVFNKVKASLESKGKWSIFHEHYTKVMQVLRKMSRRGILVDRPEMDAAFARLGKRLDSEVGAIQPLFPLHLRKEIEWRGSEKKRPPLSDWYEKEVPLTEKELSRMAKKEEKEREKSEKRLARELARKVAKGEKKPRRTVAKKKAPLAAGDLLAPQMGDGGGRGDSADLGL